MSMPFFFTRLTKLLISLENGMMIMVILCPCIIARAINKMLFPASISNIYIRYYTSSSLIIACMHSFCFTNCYIALLPSSFYNAINNSASISFISGFLLLLYLSPPTCLFLPYGFIRFPFLRKRYYS